MSKYLLSNREKIVMDEFWKEGTPLTTMDLMRKLKDEIPYTAQLHRIINSLLEKGLIQVCGATFSGRRCARQFQYTISQEDFESEILLEDFGGNKRKLKKFAVALVHSIAENETEDKEAFLDELNQIIEKYKQGDPK